MSTDASATKPKRMTFPFRLPQGSLKPFCGFALFAAWLTLLPHTVIANSTVVRSNALLLGCMSIVLLAGMAALDRAFEGKDRRAWLALCALACAGAGAAFFVFPSEQARTICLCLQMAGGIGMLLYWGRILNPLPSPTLLAHAIGALGSASVVQLAATGLGAVAGILGNEHAASSLMLALLVPLAPLSCIMGWPATLLVEGNNEDDQCSYRAHVESEGVRETPIVLTCVIILCAASLTTSFMSGFASLPHYVGWVPSSTLRACIDLVIVITLLILLGRPAKKRSHTSVFLLLNLALSVLGILLLTLDSPSFSLAARSIMEAARDCNTVLGITLLCSLTKADRAPFFPAFAAGVLGMGLLWGYDAGLVCRHLLGYDPQTLSPLAAACIAVLTVPLFLFAIRNQNDGNPNAASSQEASLDAASARHVIEKTHEKTLAPYHLSPRELEVSLLMLDGFTAVAASKELGISLATVKFHLGNAYRKIGIQSKQELVSLAKQGKETPHGD